MGNIYTFFSKRVDNSEPDVESQPNQEEEPQPNQEEPQPNQEESQPNQEESQSNQEESPTQHYDPIPIGKQNMDLTKGSKEWGYEVELLEEEFNFKKPPDEVVRMHANGRLTCEEKMSFLVKAFKFAHPEMWKQMEQEASADGC